MVSTKPLAVIQPRVSSREQRNEGFSLSAQEKLLRAYCEQKDIEIVRPFPITETASKPQQRRLFREMMDFVREQNIKLIVVEKVDRLVRSFVDLVAIDAWLEEDGERQVHFVKDSIILHRGSRSQEKLNWGIRVLLAKNFIDNMKEEVEKGIQEKLAQGGLPGKPPIGYEAVGEIGRKELIPDEMAPLVTKMFDLYLEPLQSVTLLTHKMKELGLRTKTGRSVVRSYIRAMLSNEIYIGKIPWAGKTYAGRHVVLVDEAVFNAVQEKLSGRAPAPRYQRHDSLFRGLMMCKDCSSRVTWELHKGRYYGKCKGYRRCTRRSYLREDRLEAALLARLDGLIAPSSEIVEAVMAEERKEMQRDSHIEDTRRRKLTSRLEDLERRLLIIYEDRLDGRITTERYDQLKEKYQQEQEDISEKLARPRVGHSGAVEDNLALVQLCLQAGRVYRKGTKDAKRALVREIFSNFDLEGEDVAWEWTEPVAAVAATVDEDRKLHDNFEPGDFGSTKRKEALTRASMSLWQGWQDSNPRHAVLETAALPTELHPYE